MRDDRERLLDIIEAIERIDRRTTEGREAFDNDELLQVWVVRHLEIIGEACRGLSPAFRARHAEYGWSKPIGMRDILTHHYFDIDLDIVWEVVERDLPELRSVVDAALEEPI